MKPTTLLLPLAAALLLGGCATVFGVMPPAPSDAQLANDGTPEAQAALLNRYEVRVTNNSIFNMLSTDTVDVGPARRPTTEGWLDLDAQSDVRAYLGTTSGDETARETKPWRYLGFGAAAVMGAAGLVWLIATVGFNIAGTAGVLSGVTTFLPTDVAATGFISAVAFAILILGEALGGAVLVFCQLMVRRAIREEAARFNLALRQRVQRAVKAPDPVPPPAAAARSEVPQAVVESSEPRAVEPVTLPATEDGATPLPPAQ